MVYRYLSLLRDFLQQATSKVKLKSPAIDDTEVILKPPSVVVGWNQSNWASAQELRNYPLVAIGLEGNVTVEMDVLNLPVSVAVIVYNPGTIVNGVLQSSNDGYADLWTLLDVISRALMQTDNIGGEIVLLNRKIEIVAENAPESLDEVGLDYWIGYMRFDLEVCGVPDILCADI